MLKIVAGACTEISHTADNLSKPVIKAGHIAGRKVIDFLRELSHYSYSLYGIDSFEKWAKLVIAVAKYAKLHIPNAREVVGPVLDMHELFKDLLYATGVLNTTADFVKVSVKANGKEKITFQLPKMKDKKGNESIDFVKFLYGIGNFFETGKFLQKYKVFKFELCTEVANTIGSCRVFNFENLYVKDLPLIPTFLDKPKDLCVFIASFIEIHRVDLYHYPRKIKEFDVILKLSGSVGKIILITFGASCHNLMWFGIVDIVTQGSSVVRQMLQRNKQRIDRFNKPALIG